MGKTRPSIPTLVVLAMLVAPAVQARDLSFEERVEAQAAIERVYYSYQIGTTRPFEEAVPRAVLEAKVERYLKQSAALERFWSTPVTAAMLQAEMERQARQTRMPERLRLLYAALGGDPFLVRECLARPALVERLARNFFAFDGRLHGEARAQAEELRQGLLDHGLQAFADDPRGSEVEIIEQSGGDPAPPRIELGPDAFAAWRGRVPERPGEVGPIREERESLSISVVAEERSGWARLVRFTVPKQGWDAWWLATAASLDGGSVQAADGGGPLPALAAVASCRPDDTWAGLDEVPDPRSENTAVWTGSEMIVWGGKSLDNEDPITGGRYNPATDSWTATSLLGAPSGRRNHAAVWTGSEMIVWGGWTGVTKSGGGYLNTGARYDPATDSWTATSLLGAPSGRSHHTAVWSGSKMIVWGGIEQGGMLNTGGRYDAVSDSWIPTSTLAAPSARWNHTAVWTGSQMIVWGGSGAGGDTLNTGARYDPATNGWSPTSLAGAPIERSGHTAVWTGSRMVVWGGGSGTTLSTGGRYDPATNSWTSTATAPLGRTGHIAVWTGTEMIVWGGTGTGAPGVGGRYDPLTDAWALTTAAASEPRFGHTAVWTGALMIVWGGNLDTGGRYDPATDSWTPIAGGLNDRRYDHTAVWTGNHMVVWGGRKPGFLNTGFRYDPATNTSTPTSIAGAPSLRAHHTAVWTGDLMVVWGGGSGAPLNTGGRYDVLADSWTPTSTTAAPTPREWHTAVWTGSEMIVWGGTPGVSAGGRYNPVADSWTPTSTTAAPSPRIFHTAVWTGSEMIVWGGVFGSALDSGGRYSPALDLWTPTSSGGAPAPRYNHSAVWTGSEMIVWGGGFAPGGESGSGLNTGGRYDLAHDTWAPTATADAPSARSGHGAVWTGNEMVVWGGEKSDGFVWEFFESGGRYDPVTNAWTATSTVGAPLGRSHPTAVWTGSEMLVWGGYTKDRENDPDIYFVLPLNGGAYALGQAVDDDGDGLSECDGDCNDGNAAVSPAAAEGCDGLDNDCSGIADDVDVDGDGYFACFAADCDDSDAGAHAVPAEITGVRFLADGQTLAWDSAVPGAGSATVHDVLTGLVTELPVGAGASESCLESSLAESTTLVADVPGTGAASWYLVRGANGCGAGSYGSASDGTPRESNACP